VKTLVKISLNIAEFLKGKDVVSGENRLARTKRIAKRVANRRRRQASRVFVQEEATLAALAVAEAKEEALFGEPFLPLTDEEAFVWGGFIPGYFRTMATTKRTRSIPRRGADIGYEDPVEFQCGSLFDEREYDDSLISRYGDMDE
jgi:hypothetical protein